MDYVKLGKQISASRKDRGWTQGELAKRIKRSVSFVGHVERGTRKASMETLSTLCDVLEISMDDALGRTGSDRLTRVEADVAELRAALELAQKITIRIQNALPD